MDSEGLAAGFSYQTIYSALFKCLFNGVTIEQSTIVHGDNQCFTIPTHFFRRKKKQYTN